MSNRVDPSVGAVQLPFAHADRDPFRAQAACFELASRDGAMLASSDFSHCRIGRVDLSVHMDE